MVLSEDWLSPWGGDTLCLILGDQSMNHVGRQEATRKLHNSEEIRVHRSRFDSCRLQMVNGVHNQNTKLPLVRNLTPRKDWDLWRRGVLVDTRVATEKQVRFLPSPIGVCLNRKDGCKCSRHPDTQE